MTHTSSGASKEALFCIGSNCGDREGNVERALIWLSGILSEFRHSPIYATPDCHGGQREYMNAVGIGTTALEPSLLESLCKQYELECGRDTMARVAGNVPVDIDLIALGENILREKDYRSDFFLKGYSSLRETSSCYLL